jgi:hypothetical protein
MSRSKSPNKSTTGKEANSATDRWPTVDTATSELALKLQLTKSPAFKKILKKYRFS